MEIKGSGGADDLWPVFATTIIILLIIFLIWRVMELLWIRPKKLERWLRKQGLKGNPYRPFLGDAMELLKLMKEPTVLPRVDFPDACLPGITAFFNKTVQKHGKDCFVWLGPSLSLIITTPELIREVLTKYEDYQKPNHQFNKLLMVGLFGHEGETWAKHRKIINPAFHLEKLKNMFDAMYVSCSKLTSAWEEIVSEEGSTELDVWPFLESLTGDVISKAAFDISYQDGRRIFDLLKEHGSLMMRFQVANYVPGLRFLPTKTNRRVKQICKEVEALLTAIIDSRKKELEAGGCNKDDLLGILLESNMREIKEHGNVKGSGLTTNEVVQECKLFYLAGQETTSSLLVWTLILLSKHQIWQERARAEVLQVFGKDQKPNFEGLNRLKVGTMILYEVLRLYPPVYAVMRKVYKDIKLSKWLIPKGTELLLPMCILHQDRDVWGEDAKEFNPERFSEGLYKATKGQGAFLPFSTGPRICIGQNFALLEAKLALAMILQLFALDLSPTYIHAPYAGLMTQPHYGANLILHKL